jgi:hypothetical protein
MADEVKVELGFDGGGVLRCSLETAAFEELAQAFAATERGAFELQVDGERALADLARVVYIRQLRTGRAISFAE